MKRAWLLLLAASCFGQSPADSPAAPAPDKATQTAAQPANAAAAVATPAATTPTAVNPAATPNPQMAMAASQAAMAASIDKQRAAVGKQVSAVTGKSAPPTSGFFTVPWIDAPPRVGVLASALFNEPLCDPLPSEQLDPLIEENAKRESVRADLLRAVIGQESGRRPCAVSPKGAQGLMQLMPSTAEQFGVRDPFDPKQNVEAGTKLLKQLLTKYGGDIRLALSAYNAGTERVDKDGGVPQIPETINYVTDILAKLPAQ